MIIFFLFFNIAAAQTSKNLNMFNGKNYDKVKLTNINAVFVNNVCIKNKNCLALLASKHKKSAPTGKSGLTGNPASTYCVDHQGVPRILKDDRQNEYDYCLFKDGSLADSWDLYYKHFSRETK